jgi:hypothetical protein
MRSGSCGWQRCCISWSSGGLSSRRWWKERRSLGLWNREIKHCFKFPVQWYRLPISRHLISVKSCVHAQDRQLFLQSLCNQEAIKRVPVMKGKFSNKREMIDFDGKNFKLIHAQLLLDEFAVWQRDTQSSKADLDGHFPQAATLRNNSFLSIINSRAIWLRRESSSINQRKACVSTSSFMTYIPENPPAPHQNPLSFV